MNERGRWAYRGGGRRSGNSAYYNWLANKALGEGKTVVFVSLDEKGEVVYEQRGIKTAKDVTPAKPLLLPPK